MSVFKAALVGKHIAHSISPRVHEEIFRVLGSRLGGRYTSIDYTLEDCEESCDLAAWIKTASANGIHGANVTIPYKSDAYRLAQIHVGTAAAIESANTLTFNGVVTALSTDGVGLLGALLREYPSFNLENYHLVCLGAGNAARAVLYALCTRWMPQSLSIINRSHEQAEDLATFCIAQAPGPTVRVMGINEFINNFDEPSYRLVLQTTPVGSIAHPGNLAAGFVWHETDLAIDLTYNPLRTPFLQNVHDAGAKTINGLGMLIEQAAFAQAYWLSGTLPERSPLSESEYEDIKVKLTKELS